MFSFKHVKSEKPRAIGLVSGGKHDGNLVYFYSNPSKPDKDFVDHIELFDGQLTPVPNIDPDQRDIFIIAGGSGLGKSTLAGSIMQVYRSIYPKRPIYIFSKVKEDPSIDDLKISDVKRILLDDTFLEGEPLVAANFKQSLVLFDDVDTLTGQVKKAVQELRSDLMATARHTECTMIVTLHLLMNYKDTRDALLEGTCFTIWPRANTYQCLRFSKAYMGLSTKASKNLIKLPSRNVTFMRSLFPPVLMTSNEVMLFSRLDNES